MPQTGTSATERERKYTTISIPTPLYEQVKKRIEGRGFRSASEFIIHAARVAITEEGRLLPEGTFPPTTEEATAEAGPTSAQPVLATRR